MRIRSYNEKTVVAVFITKYNIQKIFKQQPHKRIDLLNRANQKAKVILYFFSIKDFDLRNKIINGAYYDDEISKWIRKEFPYPDVLYRRGYGDIVSNAEKRKFKNFMEQMRRNNTKLLNYQNGFDKWEVYEKLMLNDNISPHLPYTQRLVSSVNIDELLKKYKSIYIKARIGRQGKQVIKVMKHDDNLYEYRYFTNRVRIGKTNDSKRLLKLIHKHLKTDKALIQEGIDLLSINERIIDLRAEVQRDGSGKLVIVAIPVRIAQSKAPITTHASSQIFESFFKNQMSYSTNEIRSLKFRLHEFIFQVYEHLEQHYGKVGELGIDLAIDTRGKIWFIECNSQSAKVSLMNAYNQKTIDNVFLNPLKYAKHLYQCDS